MKKVLTVILLSLCCTVCLAQRGDLRKGNRHFAKGEYQEADISYRKGLLKDSSDVAAKYNLANTLYREGNYDEAKKLLTYDYEAIKDNPHAADIYFNLGNIAIAQQDWQGAVDAYIKCLMIAPDDIQAKENYTYARYHLQNQDQNQDGDGENNQDQNKDQQDQNNDQQNQDQQDQNKDQKDQNQQQQQQPVELSPQQAQQLLQAIQEKERETQEKVDKEKAAVLQSRQKEKNW